MSSAPGKLGRVKRGYEVALLPKNGSALHPRHQRFPKRAGSQPENLCPCCRKGRL